MYWADKIAQEIIDCGNHKPYWVDDMKTPSGRIHVGSLRGVVVHDLVHRALKDKGQGVTFSYVFEDHDPMDDIPSYFDRAQWEHYLGFPLFKVPSPDRSSQNYGAFFALEFQHVFNKIGSSPKIIWMSEVYQSGRMNDGIRMCLDKAEIIRGIYEELYEKKMPDNWYPFNPVCPKCNKQSTTKVSSWDGTEVMFTCEVNAVEWTNGCGYSGKQSPFSESGQYRGKMPWKVEWPVKWQTIGVTIEGAGKDHMSAGGSHDFAKLMCDRVLNYPIPFAVPYEFFLVGGKKMSSSKGRGSSAIEVSQILPPYLLRFLMVRTHKDQTIDFDPMGMTIPNLFDEYDRCWQAYSDGSDPDLGRIFELSQIDEFPEKKKLFLPRFRDIANFIELPNVDVTKRFAEAKGSALTETELKILTERIEYVKAWLNDYAPDEYRYRVSEKNFSDISLSDAQWNFLNQLAPIWGSAHDPEKLQSDIFTLTKTLNVSTKDAFKALYQVVLDKSHGPRAGWLLKKFDKPTIIARLALNRSEAALAPTVETIDMPNYFSIAQKVKDKFPSVSIGIAVINNVSIQKNNPELEQEKVRVLEELQSLTTENLGQYPEIISYRKLYKEMGIDWHSRRPSPEALLRRVALGKGLYSINTCVDAYNLVVMKHRVSVGAFDADFVQFPTTLQFAEAGDEILLLGDTDPTKYTEKELAYYDKSGGYNIDFNYRDAQRTKVSESTKNIWINVDGIYDISPEQVFTSLKETVAIIQKYCGGTVEFMGLVK